MPEYRTVRILGQEAFGTVYLAMTRFSIARSPTRRSKAADPPFVVDPVISW
jgi:hypothetical protein